MALQAHGSVENFECRIAPQKSPTIKKRLQRPAIDLLQVSRLITPLDSVTGSKDAKQMSSIATQHRETPSDTSYQERQVPFAFSTSNLVKSQIKLKNKKNEDMLDVFATKGKRLRQKEPVLRPMSINPAASTKCVARPLNRSSYDKFVPLERMACSTESKQTVKPNPYLMNEKSDNSLLLQKKGRFVIKSLHSGHNKTPMLMPSVKKLQPPNLSVEMSTLMKKKAINELVNDTLNRHSLTMQSQPSKSRSQSNESSTVVNE